MKDKGLASLEVLDPITTARRRAAGHSQDEFAGSSSQETIERYLAESLDRLGAEA